MRIARAQWWLGHQQPLRTGLLIVNNLHGNYGYYQPLRCRVHRRLRLSTHLLRVIHEAVLECVSHQVCYPVSVELPHEVGAVPLDRLDAQ